MSQNELERRLNNIQTVSDTGIQLVCPQCDDIGGTIFYAGSLWHRQCYNHWREEYNAYLDLEEPRGKGLL